VRPHVKGHKNVQHRVSSVCVSWRLAAVQQVRNVMAHAQKTKISRACFYFEHTMMSELLCDLRFSLDQQTKSAEGWYNGILKYGTNLKSPT